MKNSRIVLVNPPDCKTRADLLPPVGIGLVASYAMEKGYEISIADLFVKVLWINRFRLYQPIDMNVFWDIDRVAAYLQGEQDLKMKELLNGIIERFTLEKFDIIAFSVTNNRQLRTALCLAKELKKNDRTIIFGGAITNTNWDISEIVDFDFVDYLVNGDGEEAFVRILDSICRDKAISDYSGIISSDHREHSRASFPIERKSIPVFDDASLPFYKKLSGRLVLPVLLAQGCYNTCTFCISQNSFKYMYTSPNKTVDEIEYLKDRYNTSYFYFCNPYVNINPEFENLCDLLIRKDLSIKWGSFVSPVNINDGLAAKMNASGCRFLFLGVESGSMTVLKRMGRKNMASLKELSNAVKLLSVNGINVTASFMIGFIKETKEDFEETLDFIKKHARYMYYLNIGNFVLGKGSLAQKYPEQFGIIIRKEDNKVKRILNVVCEYDYKDGQSFEEIKKEHLIRLKRAYNLVILRVYLINTVPRHIFLYAKQFFRILVYVYHCNWATMFAYRPHRTKKII